MNEDDQELDNLDPGDDDSPLADSEGFPSLEELAAVPAPDPATAFGKWIATPIEEHIARWEREIQEGVRDGEGNRIAPRRDPVREEAAAPAAPTARLKEAVVELMRSMGTGVRGLTEIPWLAAFQQERQQVGLLALQKSRRWFERSYSVPGELFRVVATAQPVKRSLRFEIFGPDGELATTIDGGVVVGAAGAMSAPFTCGRTKIDPDHLKGGFIVVKPDGTALQLQSET